jgi:hypothetical protein
MRVSLKVNTDQLMAGSWLDDTLQMKCLNRQACMHRITAIYTYMTKFCKGPETYSAAFPRGSYGSRSATIPVIRNSAPLM